MLRYESLRTCDDVRALSRGVGESLTLDYKQDLGSRRDLASDVCALANTQGGILVIGVKDPEPEGSPPKLPDDFRGVRVRSDLVHSVESQLLDAISPRVFPKVKVTEDSFQREGRDRCFLLIDVPASSQLHQVTVERDFKFYRRAEYQNRAMTADEVRLRMEVILSGTRGLTTLFESEINRLDEIMSGSYLALLAAPSLEHRMAVDLGQAEVRVEIARLATARPHGTTSLVPSGVAFEPTGDGARATSQLSTTALTTECRVRRNSFVSHAQTGEALDTSNNRLLVARDSPTSQLWREMDEWDSAAQRDAQDKAGRWGRPSSVVDPAAAVRVRTDVLREKVTTFFGLVRGVYEIGGWRGPIRAEAVASGMYGFFPAVSSRAHEIIDYLKLAETTKARAAVEFDYGTMELRSDDLVDELLHGLARNFGMDEFPIRGSR